MKRFLFIIIILITTFMAFSRDLQEIIKSGYIVAGVRESPTIYIKENGVEGGFSYELAKEFAKSLGVELRLKIVKSFGEYWTKDGKNIIDENKKITPDVYDQIDFAAEIFTVTPSRELKVKMIPYIESLYLVVGPEKTDINNFYDLKNKKIALVKDMVFEDVFIKELKKRNIPYFVREVTIKNDKIVYIDTKPSEPGKVEILSVPNNIKFSPFIGYNWIYEKQIDFAVNSSTTVFQHITQNNMIKSYTTPYFSFGDSAEIIAFAASYETPKLSEKLESFFRDFKKSSAYDSIFKKYFSISYNEYMKIIAKK